jgi:hypothetical protein
MNRAENRRFEMPIVFETTHFPPMMAIRLTLPAAVVDSGNPSGSNGDATFL